MKKSITRATAGLAALALVAGACGSDDDSSSTADTASDDTEVASDDAAEAESDAANDDVEATDDTAADEEATDDTAADSGDDAASGDCDSLDEVSLQLQWFTQAQFGGYYAAVDQGFFEDQCLDVEIKEGAVEIVPQTELANGNADFAIAWVPKALQTREAGADITNIAQVFERSGTLQVSFADNGITSPTDFEGKTIGNWGFGNEYEVFAAIGEAGLDPATDVDLVGQQFDMIALLEGEIDAAEAMTYNEYAQVLEAPNPDTGELYQPEDFNVISYEDEGVGMLQDAIWADAARLADDEAYRDQAVRFVAAALQGWAYCRDNVEECATIVTEAGSTLGASHQQWMMNEVNKLIWPASGESIGLIDQAAWDQTVEISQNTPNLEGATVLTEDPGDGAFTNDIVTEAIALLDGVDLVGADYAAIDVTLNEGGE
ncbi:ABC transporter substrate-binding protein [Ilumatobacter sp.]|uniref:ABC transporter substrate-binding protein n=1 Tax=Ilumatobacter sp. TaxID=1967498 RepID=UPI003C3434F2